MIICMSDIICVTNRRLCREDFFERVEKIADCRPKAIILREKDLSGEEYFRLAKRVREICERKKIPCILHSFVSEAVCLGAEEIHLPLPLLRELDAERAKFKVIGTSVHSVSEAVEAQKLGAAYITAGHIFDTDCKKGLPGRGLDFLKEVRAAADIPVFAIGGISPKNCREVLAAGADGVCIMSALMQCENVQAYFEEFE